MGSTVFPAPSAGKTMYRTTLTSGTSWTVPAGVTYVNVTLVGGGGGGGQAFSSGFSALDGKGGAVIASNLSTTPGASITYAIGAGGATNAGNGGSTTFTGATTAAGGGGGSGGNTNGPTGSVGLAAGNGGGGGATSYGNGGAGGAGAIYIEYWV